MRTKANPSGTALLTVLLVAAVFVLALLAARLLAATSLARTEPLPHASVAESDTPPLPPDVLALGSEVTPLPPEGMIPSDQALDVARREFPFIAQPGLIDAYLVELSDPNQMGGLGARDRPVWIIRASGHWDIFSRPVLPDGTAADPGGVATRGYIYVDAVTGDWLQAHFQ